MALAYKFHDTPKYYQHINDREDDNERLTVGLEHDKQDSRCRNKLIIINVDIEEDELVSS